MPIPGTQEIRKPLLEAFRGEAPRSFAMSEILEIMAGYFGLNLNDLSSGDKTSLKEKIKEAKSDLKKNSLLYNPSNNTYMITNAGNEVLDDNPEIITDQYLYDRKHKPLPVAETFGLEAPDPEPPAPEPEPVMPPVETEPEELPEEPLPNIPELEPELPEEIPELELEPETETFQEEAAELEAIETEEEPEPEPEPKPETEAMTELEPELPEELPEISPEEQLSDDITLEDEPEAITEEYAEPETEEQEITEEIEPEEPEFPEASEEDENYTETEPAEFEGSEDFSGQEFENAPEEILEPGEEYKEEMPEDTYNPEETQEELAPEEYSEPEETQETEYDTEPDIQPEEDPEEEPEEIEEDESFLTASIPSNNIDDVIARHNSELADELLMRAAGLPSDRFEMLVIDLLSKMGYFAFQTARYTTESSGSDLIHGVILDNKTGANIYIQARKLSPGRTVGRADIQDFVEELSDKGGKGIYATTATFSENAKVYANDERIMLIDGVKLANLMIANNFCVNVEKVYEVKAIDGESFSEYED